MSEEKFNWAEDADIVVFPTTRGIAVYANENDHVVIRQQAGSFCGDDSFIVVPPPNVGRLVDALHLQLEEIGWSQSQSERTIADAFRSYVRANRAELAQIVHMGDGKGGYLLEMISEELGLIPRRKG